MDAIKASSLPNNEDELTRQVVDMAMRQGGLNKASIRKISADLPTVGLQRIKAILIQARRRRSAASVEKTKPLEAPPAPKPIAKVASEPRAPRSPQSPTPNALRILDAIHDVADKAGGLHLISVRLVLEKYPRLSRSTVRHHLRAIYAKNGLDPNSIPRTNRGRIPGVGPRHVQDIVRKAIDARGGPGTAGFQEVLADLPMFSDVTVRKYFREYRLAAGLPPKEVEPKIHSQMRQQFMLRLRSAVDVEGGIEIATGVRVQKHMPGYSLIYVEKALRELAITMGVDPDERRVTHRDAKPPTQPARPPKSVITETMRRVLEAIEELGGLHHASQSKVAENLRGKGITTYTSDAAFKKVYRCLGLDLNLVPRYAKVAIDHQMSRDEVRERVIKTAQDLGGLDRFSIGDLVRALGISEPTARRYVREVHAMLGLVFSSTANKRRRLNGTRCPRVAQALKGFSFVQADLWRKQCVINARAQALENETVALEEHNAALKKRIDALKNAAAGQLIALAKAAGRSEYPVFRSDVVPTL